MQAYRGGNSVQLPALRSCVPRVLYVLCFAIVGFKAGIAESTADGKKDKKLNATASTNISTSRPSMLAALKLKPLHRLNKTTDSIAGMKKQVHVGSHPATPEGQGHAIDIQASRTANASRLHADPVGHLVEVAASADSTLYDARSASKLWFNSKKAEVELLTTGAKDLKKERLDVEASLANLKKLMAKDPEKLSADLPAYRPQEAEAHYVQHTSPDRRDKNKKSYEDEEALNGHPALKRSLIRRDRQTAAAGAISRDASKAQDPACCNKENWEDRYGRDCEWYADNLQQCDTDARNACCICHLGRRPDKSCWLRPK